MTTTTPIGGTGPTETDPLPALRHQRDFLAWFASDFLTRVSASLTTMALPLLAATVAPTTAHAGWIVGAAGLGTTLGLLPGGVLADRGRRRRIVTGCALLGAALDLLVALVAAAAGGSAAPWLVLVLVFGGGFCSALAVPAFTASLKRVVHPRQFGRAVSATEGRAAVIALAVPPIGGVLFGLAMGLPYVVAAAVLACGGVLATRLRETYASVGESSEHAAPSARTALVGLKIVLEQHVLRLLLLTGMGINLAGSAVMSTVIFELHNRGTEPVIIGLLSTAVAACALIGAVLSAAVIGRVRGGVIVTGGLCWIVAGLVMLAAVDSPVAMALLVASGALAAPAVNAVVGGYTLAVIPAEVQGRADAAMTLVSSLALPLAPVLAGAGLAAFGFHATAAGLALLVAACAAPCLLARRVRRLAVSTEWTDPDA